MTGRPPFEGETDLVFLDACCLINLFATGRVEEILEALPYDFVVARYVAEEEVLEVKAEEADEREPLRPRIGEMVARGLLSLIEISSELEESLWVRFAAHLDDGEAQTLALASIRGARVATDDKKALRVANEAWKKNRKNEGRPACLRTSELLFEWVEREGIDEPNLGKILRAIAHRASFLPPRTDPHFDRWMELIALEREP